MNLGLSFLLLIYLGTIGEFGAAAEFKPSISPKNPIQKEGEYVGVNCTLGPGQSWKECRLLVNGKDSAQTGKNIRSTKTANGTSFKYGPLGRSDNGSTFVCEAQGMKSAKSTIVVAWFDGIELSKTSVKATVGDTIAVNIMPKANPMPVFSVTKSGSANSTVGVMTNRTFTLEAVQMADTGIYALKAENLAGSETAEVNITVEAKVDEDGASLTIGISAGAGGLFLIIIGVAIGVGGYWCYKKSEGG